MEETSNKTVPKSNSVVIGNNGGSSSALLTMLALLKQQQATFPLGFKVASSFSSVIGKHGIGGALSSTQLIAARSVGLGDATATLLRNIEQSRVQLGGAFPLMQAVSRVNRIRESSVGEIAAKYAAQRISDLWGLAVRPKYVTDSIFDLRDSITTIERAAQAAGLSKIASSFNEAQWQAAISALKKREPLSEEETHEVQAVANEIATQALGQSLNKIEDSLASIVESIKSQPSQRQTLVLTVLLPLILWILGLILTPVIDFYGKEYLSQREAEKAIKKKIVAAVGAKETLAAYRFVKKDRLVVHMNPKARSPSVGHLYFGQTVEVLKTIKDWTLVRWSDSDTEVCIQGWVFTRHLSKFK